MLLDFVLHLSILNIYFPLKDNSLILLPLSLAIVEPTRQQDNDILLSV